MTRITDNRDNRQSGSRGSFTRSLDFVPQLDAQIMSDQRKADTEVLPLFGHCSEVTSSNGPSFPMNDTSVEDQEKILFEGPGGTW